MYKRYKLDHKGSSNGYNINDLRSLSDDIKASEKNTCMVFATKNGEKVTFLVSLTDDVVERGYNAGKMIKISQLPQEAEAEAKPIWLKPAQKTHLK